MSIMLVEDHALIARALADALIGRGYEPVEYVPPSSLEVANVLAIGRRLRPNVALVDLNLGGGRSGLPMIGPLVDLGARVIAFTASDERLDMARSLEVGAIGLVHKAAAFDVLVSTIEEAVAGKDLVSATERDDLAAALSASRALDNQRVARLAALTPREQAVLGALMAGKSATEIACECFVAIKTVRTHIDAIHRKLGVRSQLAAVAFAIGAGWHPDGARTQ